ncbi:MAG: hypothetical protein ABIT58_05780 [Ferruginibacter sp.]
MKKNFLLILFLLPFSFLSCLQNDNKDNDPKAVLSKFFKNLSDKDITAARKITTQETQHLLDDLEHELKADKNSDAVKKFDKRNLEIAPAQVDEDRASILVTEKGIEKSIYYILVKENNGWKVKLDLAAMLVESFDLLKEQGINAGDSIAKAMQELRALRIETPGKDPKAEPKK